ncbi:hypothetical protein Nham_3466 [Nitrobacter hamburgensis X14]|uniref:Uncharacterized protein n=1 Tax=Nitrobacter hamburgensis (strain DSM 10229 / NCIMB 13809 / X14) TaxID=323097 RepID=Q1QHV2_NITHX|nr:hypothetical protein Nham_3466 [Nitrobacter hamburgensis X14]
MRLIDPKNAGVRNCDRGHSLSRRYRFPGAQHIPQSDFQALMRECALPRNSRSLREHNHFAFDDLIFGNKIWTGFRIHRDFRVRKALLDHSDSLGLVGDGDKDEFLAQCATGASARPHGTDLPTFYHSSV